MRPPCPDDGSSGKVPAVHGYGDANADFHLVGDHPGVHGGRATGVPFTGSVAGERLQPVLNEVGLLGDAYSDEPAAANLFASYLHACCLPEDRQPTDREYDDMERFFDAELRAIAAHVLLPVGERATRHVLGTYAAREALLDRDGMATLHAEHVPGRGFLVVPIREPSEWDERGRSGKSEGSEGRDSEQSDRERLVDSLSDLLASDYRQTADLSRFVATDDTYEVR